MVVPVEVQVKIYGCLNTKIGIQKDIIISKRIKDFIKEYEDLLNLLQSSRMQKN
jgi:hypothetical protein